MTQINDAYINALLADAAYVEKLNEADNPEALVTALTGRMTIDLAEFIADNFTVVTQGSNSGIYERCSSVLQAKKLSLSASFLS
ncbi:hypothetical protein AB835_11235 [Candidatus Endobugula sertula]|uniref:Uncharacterized protein n=1 Tax=Candidatus Endobugula sertula TaxID=62101 RepID=A0A1D2QN06_9GAMM|nr:hypothetical protein AB835_11235 [Candidatus Endobugula sertula]